MFGGKSMCGFPDGRTKQNNKKQTNKTNRNQKQRDKTELMITLKAE